MNMNVQFAIDSNAKRDGASQNLTVLASAQTTQHNGTDLNQAEFEVDPDLHGEVEIDLPQASARTRTTMSAKSGKSKKSDVTENRANIVRSRGRPMKPHETEPFLSIDNLPADKTFLSEKNPSTFTPRPSTYRSGLQDKSPFMPQHGLYMTPYGFETPGPPSPSVVSDKKSPDGDLVTSRPVSRARSVEIHLVPFVDGSRSRPGSAAGPVNGSRPNTGSAKSRNKQRSRPGTGSRPGNGSRPGSQRGRINVGQFRSMPSRNGRITPANTPYQTQQPTHPPNCQIKTPFKHSVLKPVMTPEGRITPSQGLKERTTLAASHLTKILTVAGEKDAHKQGGKLKKGKLKPLYPVNVQGPSIEKCRGIIAETRQYGASPSRTLQRRLQLINSIPNVHEYLYDRPHTVESVHRTSIASSIDDNLNNIDYDDNLDSDRLLPDEVLYPLPQQGSYVEPFTPENTFIPVQTHENTQVNMGDMSERSERMFATEISANEKVGEESRPVTGKLQHELYVGESQELRKDTEVLPDVNNSNDQDPSAALDNDENKEAVREDARIIGSSKSVRFREDNDTVDGVENTKEIKQKTNADIVKQDKAKQDGKDSDKNKTDKDCENEDDSVSKKNKENKSSCKTSDVNDIYRKKDDDNHDGDAAKDSNDRNTGGNSNVDSSSSNGGSAKDKGGNSNGTSGDNGDNSGKQAAGFKRGSRRPASAPVTRPSSGNKRSQVARKPHMENTRKAGHCSKFTNSPASKSHTPSLQVSSVIHGNSVATSLRPESPNRSPSRPCSPDRRHPPWSGADPAYLQGSSFFSHFSESTSDITYSDYTSTGNKSRVKFMIDGETPEIDTIFIEDDDEIELDIDKNITFDAIDTELAMLRSNIHNQLQEHLDMETAFETQEEDIEETENESEVDEDEQVGSSSVAMDTIREDYSNLIEKYRQRCMDRSEGVGAISNSLMSPRDNTLPKWQTRSESRNSKQMSEEYSDKMGDFKSRTVLSDSGHGSVDNLSEMSRTVSSAVSDIPRLELGGSLSDLGTGTGRSDVTAGSDVTLTGNDEDGSDDEGNGTRNLLELVCDSLAPLEEPAKRESRKEKDENVTDLQVVATTKSLSKTKKPKSIKSSQPKAPFPPLCFTINARPPAGFLYYFAYGPDMNPNRFSSYIKREITDRYWGLLFGFSLVFNKKGSSIEAGGFANLEFNPLRSVEGCLYKITQDELQVLDKCVGYPEHYEHLMLPVWMSNSKDPEQMGIAQYCVPALTYIAQNAWTETEQTLPCDYAISQCIKSADLVTNEYKDSLVTMATQQPVQVSA